MWKITRKHQHFGTAGNSEICELRNHHFWGLCQGCKNQAIEVNFGGFWVGVSVLYVLFLAKHFQLKLPFHDGVPKGTYVKANQPLVDKTNDDLVVNYCWSVWSSATSFTWFPWASSRNQHCQWSYEKKQSRCLPSILSRMIHLQIPEDLKKHLPLDDVCACLCNVCPHPYNQCNIYDFNQISLDHSSNRIWWTRKPGKTYLPGDFKPWPFFIPYLKVTIRDWKRHLLAGGWTNPFEKY